MVGDAAGTGAGATTTTTTTKMKWKKIVHKQHDTVLFIADVPANRMERLAILNGHQPRQAKPIHQSELWQAVKPFPCSVCCVLAYNNNNNEKNIKKRLVWSCTQSSFVSSEIKKNGKKPLKGRTSSGSDTPAIKRYGEMPYTGGRGMGKRWTTQSSHAYETYIMGNYNPNTFYTKR